MSIVDYLDLDNIEHLIAIRYLYKNGRWHTKFYNDLPGNIEWPHLWQTSLAFKMSERYLSMKIKEK